ncbi:Actin-related protein [Carpediemonas membranifera]|uniref:Actin-related protein n=1 Tax=Carpediemonas membranifera TaxID=201153 RepID=A0A8J6EA50_9EUKA|nr:Actin-related protein [Carpediemonas membranifera]|eukprot:KAG9394225.1 Actin-related protein [Carpediemonas membranifera]
MGYAGTDEPSYLIPTTFAGNPPEAKPGKKHGLEDLDFFIGQEAIAKQKSYGLSYPVRHGLIENWDQMEKFWSQALFQYLHCDPEEHNFLLTEPPLNTPENREQTAEIWFETFNAGGIYIAVQAVLALCASWTSKKSASRQLTGTVIDSGDGVTHVIPVSDGAVIASAIKHIPIAGRDFTNFTMNMMRGREKMPTADALQIAMRMKERHAYVCKDLKREILAFDASPADYIKLYTGMDRINMKTFEVEMGYERFMAPEIFFNPAIYSGDFVTPLPDLVDQTIQACPIDCRKPLYNNIVLSGGSTMFQNFSKRLQRDIKKLANDRIKYSHEVSGGRIPLAELDVNVVSHKKQRYAVWYGGSLLSTTPEFGTGMVHTREDYLEYGPSICRHNPVLGLN